MQVVFTIGSGAGNDHDLVERHACKVTRPKQADMFDVKMLSAHQEVPAKGK